MLFSAVLHASLSNRLSEAGILDASLWWPVNESVFFFFEEKQKEMCTNWGQGSRFELMTALG